MATKLTEKTAIITGLVPGTTYDIQVIKHYDGILHRNTSGVTCYLCRFALRLLDVKIENFHQLWSP